MKVAFCPLCGGELTVVEIEWISCNLIWSFCSSDRCVMHRYSIKTTGSGFVLEPNFISGRYIFVRPEKGDMRR